MSIGGDNYSHFSNAIAENWMRIVKIDILNSECNLIPGDFIRTVYPDISNRISAFKFALHPRACKYLSMVRERCSWKKRVLKSGLGKRKNILDI